MSSLRPLAFLLGVLLLVIPARADLIILKNGDRIEGKVVANDGREIKIAVTKKDMVIITTVKATDVEKVQEDDAMIPIRKTYNDRRKDADALPAGFEKTVCLLELGRWARGQGLYAEAIDSFHSCQESLTDFDDVAEYEVARTQLASKDFEGCQKTVKQILDRNPKHEPAAALVNDLAHDLQDTVEEDVKKGFDYYQHNNCRRALAIFENFVKKHPADEVDVVSKECEKNTGQKLAQIMIDCRFRRGCPEPGCQSGWKKCPHPGCENGRIKEYHKLIEGPRGGAENEPITYTYCGQCNGIGQVICDRCKGTGFDLGTPTDYEKKEMVPILLEQSKKFGEQAKELATNAAQRVQNRDGRDITARILDPMSVLEHARQARFFLETAVLLAPTLNAPGGDDCRGKLQDIDDMLFDTAIASASYYLEEAERAYKEAVELQGLQNGDVKLLEGRLLAAKKAVAFAERARSYLNYVLRDCPGSTSPRMGDAKKLLAESTDMARRCHHAEEELQKVEDYLTNLTPEDIRRAIRNWQWNFR